MKKKLLTIKIKLSNMSQKLKSIIIVVLSICTIKNTIAQVKQFQWNDEVDGKYTYRYVSNDPTHTRYYTLNNGLTVILSPNKKNPRIQSYTAIRAGAKNDPVKQTGLAHYLEHMLFKGTDKIGTKDYSKEKVYLDQIDVLYEQYNQLTEDIKRKEVYKEIDRVSGQAAKYAIANEYDKLMNSLGAKDINAYTAYDMTVYHEDIPKNMVDKYLAIQGERFRKPILRLFHTELETVYEEKNMSLDRDQDQAIEAIRAALFPNHNYGKQTILGDVNHLKNPSLKAIKDFYNTYYVPNNMAVIMCGDFDPSEMIQKIDKTFSYMSSKPIPTYTSDKTRIINNPIIREVKGPNAESLYIGIPMPSAVNGGAHMHKLLCQILHNGSAGIFDLDLIKSQKVQDAWVYPYVMKDHSILLIGATPIQGQSLEELRKLLIVSLEKLKQGDFSDDLLRAVINNEIRARMERIGDYKFLAEQLTSAFTMGIDWSEKISAEQDISEITKQDIIDFANTYFTGHNYVAVNKLQGVPENIRKVEKPPINPIQVNRDVQSNFFTQILSMPESKIEAQWLDYHSAVEKLNLSDQNVFSVQNKDNKLFAQTYHYHLGQWNNKLLSLAVDYLEFIGTKDRSAEDFSKSFYKLASKFNIHVEDENTYVQITGLNSNFLETVNLLHDLLKNCKPNHVAFELFIANKKKLREDAKSDKSNIMRGLLSYAKYGALNPFNTVLTDNELNALKAEDLVAVLHDLGQMKYDILYYGPVLGKDLIKILKPLKDEDIPFKKVPETMNFKVMSRTYNEVYLADFKMNQADIRWYRSASQYSKDNDALAALHNNYFGQGMGSIVFQTIREAKALAYSTEAYFAQPSKPDRSYDIHAYVGTQVDKLNDATDAMNEIINIFPQSNQGVENARLGLMKSIASQRIYGLEILNAYMEDKKLGKELKDNRETVYNNLADLTLGDLTKFHQNEFSNKPYAYCIVAQQDDLNPIHVSKLGQLKKLSLEEIFGY